MLLKIKKLHMYAQLPKYSKEGDGALDLTTVDSGTEHELFREYKTGLAFEIPYGYVGLLFPRSSVSNKPLALSNSVGVLDSGFRGEVTFRFRHTRDSVDLSAMYKAGDRIGQLLVIPYPTITPIWESELSESERGEGGYGSSGS